MPPEKDKLNRIEDLKAKLFSRNYKAEPPHLDKFNHGRKSEIPDSWQGGGKEGENFFNPEKFFMQTRIFRNFFFFSLLVFVLALGYAAYIFFGGSNTVSNENIDIAIAGNNFTAGGEELSFVVSITNRNNSPLDLADLVIEYPKSAGGDTAQMERSRISLGTIPAGAVRNENIKAVLFGEQGSVSTINISLEYRIEGSNAIFVKNKNYDVTISSAPLVLSVDGPTTASSNQDITLQIKVSQNSTRLMPKILLKVDYPVGFVFGSSSPDPAYGNNVWNLGDLASGSTRTITVTGKMLDVADGEEKIFRISSGEQSGKDKSAILSAFNSLAYTVSIKKPFIEAKLFINGASGRLFATDSKTPVHVEIRWNNNLDTKINDLSIKAKISGNAVDQKTINAEGGFYNSLGGENIITWDKNSLGDFAEVNPGDSGTVSFNVTPLQLFSTLSGLLSEPKINIDISISGKQLLSGYAAEDLKNSDSATVKIISDVGLTSKALYYSGPFANTGPIPPKVGNKTTYTITWSLSNTSNSIGKATVRSSIPQWINFEGNLSPTSLDLVYNPATREIVWNAGRIPKGAGVTTGELNASFQVSFTPSLSQVGTTPIILNDAILTGHDDFANVDLRVTKSALRTAPLSDPQFPGGGGTVAP